MNPTPKRRLRVSDALILVAAVAFGMAWTRFFQSYEAGGESYPYVEEAPQFPIGIRLAAWWVLSLFHAAVPVTVAVLVLRLRAPRPRFRHLCRQPGFVGCAAAGLGVSVDLIDAMREVAQGLATGLHGDGLIGYTYLYISGTYASVAVASAWLLLVASGRWRPEPSWVDRLGWFLAAFWLVGPPLVEFVTWLVIAFFYR